MQRDNPKALDATKLENESGAEEITVGSQAALTKSRNVSDYQPHKGRIQRGREGTAEKRTM